MVLIVIGKHLRKAAMLPTTVSREEQIVFHIEAARVGRRYKIGSPGISCDRLTAKFSTESFSKGMISAYFCSLVLTQILGIVCNMVGRLFLVLYHVNNVYVRRLLKSCSKRGDS